MAAAMALPFGTSVKPEKSGGADAYFWVILTFFRAALAPVSKPASNRLMRSISTPPMKPTLPVLVVRPAT